MDNQVFYQCSVCGNTAMMIERSGVVPQCCGKPMERMEPGKKDGPAEKHVPVLCIEGRKVTINIGELPHPMSELHNIEWVVLQTTRGGYLRRMFPGDLPMVRFRICDNERVICAYVYCNLHGLWQSCPGGG